MADILPLRDRAYLGSHEYLFEEIDSGGQKGVVLKNVVLPASKYDAAQADILFLLPGGYPDILPDMFYIFPWIRLLPACNYPRAADQPVEFGGVTWQRWSRHSDQWRSGRDGIWTLIKRFENAVEIAQ